MEFFRIKKDIPFMRHALALNAVSFATFIASVFFLFTNGLNLSVEFTGGTVMEVAYEKPADVEAVREVLTQLNYSDVQVQNFGNPSPSCNPELSQPVFPPSRIGIGLLSPRRNRRGVANPQPY